MKKRGITFDLTPLLDVILILFFSVLLMNTEQISDYLFQLSEAEEHRIIAEEYRIIAEQERDVAAADLHEVANRLEALSEWDTERLEFIDEIDAAAIWRAAIEEAIHIVDMVVQTVDERRLLFISAQPNIDDSIEIIWTTGIWNRIQNDGFVSSEIERILQDIIVQLPNDRPVLIMFNDASIAHQEFNLIYRNIGLFIEENTDRAVRLSVYTQN